MPVAEKCKRGGYGKQVETYGLGDCVGRGAGCGVRSGGGTYGCLVGGWSGDRGRAWGFVSQKTGGLSAMRRTSPHARSGETVAMSYERNTRSLDFADSQASQFRSARDDSSN